MFTNVSTFGSNLQMNNINNNKFYLKSLNPFPGESPYLIIFYYVFKKLTMLIILVANYLLIYII